MVQVVPLAMLFSQWRCILLFGLCFIWSQVSWKGIKSQKESAASSCKVHAEGKKKKKESSNRLCQPLHSKAWPIFSNIMAHLKGSGEDINAMLTKSSEKEVQKNFNKLKPIADTVILLGRLDLPFRGWFSIPSKYWKIFKWWCG